MIGSPIFDDAVINIGNGKTFRIITHNNRDKNKYIQSAELNGKPLDRAWLRHSELAAGGRLVLMMGPRPNKAWGAKTPPPSAERIDLKPAK